MLLGSSVTLRQFTIMMAVLVLSVALHELGHALAADALGDPGPRRAGRITLWPDKHLDALGFAFMVITVLTGIGIGWGKPVIVNPGAFKHPRRDMLLVALAGPAMNLLLAILFGLVIRITLASGPMNWMTVGHGNDAVLARVVIAFISINLLLVFFNLLPIVPLDGSKVVAVLLPEHQAYQYMKTMSQIGPFLLLAIFFFGGPILGHIIGPAVMSATQIITGLH